MRHLLPVFLLLLSGLSLKGQTLGEAKEGTITFITSQNVYVKFQTTENITVGDTLFTLDGSSMIPALVVKDLSSISCVCSLVAGRKFIVDDTIITRQKAVQSVKVPDATAKPVVQALPVKVDSITLKKEQPATLKQNISGRLSVSSYSNLSSQTSLSQRMRYNFSLSAQNMGNSKLSGDVYISFVHNLKDWSAIKSDLFNGLKIYSLALNYAFDKNNNIWVGRKINPRLSNVGAIDGLQYETKFKSFTAGIMAGTRPDYMNYSFNANLLQYGGYFGHDYSNKKGGSAQTSVAFVEQTNNGNTDRRFAYLQHSNALLTNLYLFGSVEFDLYNKVKNTQDSTLTQNNKPNLSNLYVSLRYKVAKQLSFTLSYSARQNIIYYETYKTIVEQLLEASTLKGYMFQVNFHPGKRISIGANAGYRTSKTDPRPSKNLYSYVTYSNLPWLNASMTVSATLMESAYLNGSIYSVGFSRDLIPGILYGGLNYRYVTYKFQSAETPLLQNMAETDLTWRISKKLSCSLNYEGTFEKGNNYHLIYVNLTQRF